MKKFRIKSTLAIAIVIGFSLLFTVSCSRESDEMKNAKTCMGLEQYEKVLTNLETEINNKPDNGEAYLLKGEAFLFLKKGKNAEKAFETVLKINPESGPKIAEVCIRLATKFNKPGNAKGLLEFALEKDASQKEAIKLCLDNLFNSAFAAGELDTAARYADNRRKYGKERNQEFAKLFYDAIQKYPQREYFALYQACCFNQAKYGKKYALYVIEISRKQWDYQSALNGINEAIKYDPQYKTEKETMRRRLAKHFVKESKNLRRKSFNDFMKQVVPYARNKGDKKEIYLQGKAKVKIKLGPYTVSPGLDSSSYRKVRVSSKGSFYVWYFKGGGKPKFCKNGNYKANEGLYYNTYIINLSDETIEISASVD